jgi:hypothetical protein
MYIKVEKSYLNNNKYKQLNQNHQLKVLKKQQHQNNMKNQRISKLCLVVGEKNDLILCKIIFFSKDYYIGYIKFLIFFSDKFT